MLNLESTELTCAGGPGKRALATDSLVPQPCGSTHRDAKAVPAERSPLSRKEKVQEESNMHVQLKRFHSLTSAAALSVWCRRDYPQAGLGEAGKYAMVAGE